MVATTAEQVTIEELVEKLRRELQETKNELAEAREEIETLEGRVEEAKGTAEEAVEDKEYAEFQLYPLVEMESRLQRYVWRDDQPNKGTYCRECGRTRPIHRHDCPFGEVT